MLYPTKFSKFLPLVSVYLVQRQNVWQQITEEGTQTKEGHTVHFELTIRHTESQVAMMMEADSTTELLKYFMQTFNLYQGKKVWLNEREGLSISSFLINLKALQPIWR